jgi:hypothetical protein
MAHQQGVRMASTASAERAATAAATASAPVTSGSAHCAGHAAAGRTLMSGHPCGMQTHGDLAQLAATPAMTAQAKPLAPPAQVQAAVLPLSAARAFSRSPLIAIHFERPDLHASRSRPLTLALRI